MGWLGELNLWLAMGRDPDRFLEQRLVVANRDSEVLDMLPLTLANIGEEQMIHKLAGGEKAPRGSGLCGRRHGHCRLFPEWQRHRQGQRGARRDQRGNGAQDHGLIDQAPTRALEKETEV